MELEKDTIHFNSELFLGEFGAFFGGPIAAYIASAIMNEASFIAFFAVVGSILGGALVWLFLRVKHGKMRGDYSHRKLVLDIAHYTPVASMFGFFVYQPTLFLISSYFISNGYEIFYSVVLGQFVAFLFFAICLNSYRIILERVTGRRL